MSLSGFGDYYPAGTKVIYDNGTSDILTSKLYLKPGNYHLGKKIKSVDTTGISDPIEIARLNENLEEYLSGMRRQEEIVRQRAEAEEETYRWREGIERWRREEEERRRAYEADAPARALREQTRRTDNITLINTNPVSRDPREQGSRAGPHTGGKSRRGQKRKKSRKGRSRKRRSRKTSRRRGRR